MRQVLQLLGGWDLAPVPLLGLVVAAVGYLLAVSRLRARQVAPWPRRATACFLGGLAVTGFAILGPPGAFDDTFFYAHMTQHILLTMLAAPLLVLGDPVLLALRASSRGLRRRWLVPAYRSRLARHLANPVVGWLLFVGTVLVSHLPVVYDFALEHAAVHDYIEHPLYLFVATVYFYTVLGPTTGPHRVHEGLRVLSLFTVMFPMAFLGFFIYATPHVDYPFYAHVERPFGPNPLQDQRLAGALMWSSAMGLSVLWMVLGGLRWLRADERRTRRLESKKMSVAGTTTP